MQDLLNKIHHAESLEFIKKLPDKSINCICVDPPYFGIMKNDWDNQWKDIFDFQKWVGEFGREFNRILADNGSFYWFGDDKTIAYCQIVLDKYFRLLNSLVWKKPALQTMKGAESVYRSYAPITERCLFYDKGESLTGLEMVKQVMPNPFADYLKSELLRKFETIANIRKFVVHELKMDSAMVNRWFDGDSIITKEKWDIIKEHIGNDYLTREYEELRLEYEELRRVWNNDKKALDVLEYPICSDSGRFHETQKPLNLIEYILSRSTRENDIVLDCFSGSGTTAIACHNLKRRFICVEKDKDYYEASVRRLEDHKKQLNLF